MHIRQETSLEREKEKKNKRYHNKNYFESSAMMISIYHHGLESLRPLLGYKLLPLHCLFFPVRNICTDIHSVCFSKKLLERQKYLAKTKSEMPFTCKIHLLVKILCLFSYTPPLVLYPNAGQYLGYK